MKKQQLFNKISRNELKKSLSNEPFQRITASFYKYFQVSSPKKFRDNLYVRFNQLKIFGVHTIVDGEQFTYHNEREDRYTKYFSVHMLNKEPDQDLVNKITKTFFQEETLNEVRVIGKNILQCNLKVTYATPPDDSGCNEIENLLKSVK